MAGSLPVSEKLPYPRDPTAVGERQWLEDVILLLRTVFFPTRGERQNLLDRIETLEARVARLEAQ